MDAHRLCPTEALLPLLPLQPTARPITFHPTREASPVSKDHQRQPFPFEVLDGLKGLKRRVWEPNLASLLDDLLGEMKEETQLTTQLEGESLQGEGGLTD